MITCSICETATIEDSKAPENDWHPNWYIGLVEQGPCCPACGQFLTAGADGEAELIVGIDPQAPVSNDAPVMTLHEYNRERFYAEREDWTLR